VNQKLFVAGVMAAALGASAGGALASGSAKPTSCGHEGTAIGNIEATHTSCSVAKKVAHADVQGKKYDHWTCHSKRINTGAKVTCTHSGGGKVTFQVAD